MKKPFQLFKSGLAGAIIVVSLLSGVQSSSAYGESSPTPAGVKAPKPKGTPIVIGGSLGLTGQLATAAAQYKSTYEYWVKETNANGGLLGRPVQLRIYDDQSSPNVVRGRYEQLISVDKVDLLMGPYATFLTLPIIPLVNESKKVLFMAGAVSVKANRTSDWLVSTYTYQDDTFALGFFKMLDDLPKKERPKKLGVIYLQNPYTIAMTEGVDGKGGFLNMAKSRGYEVVLKESYASDVTDFSPLIRKSEEAGVDALFVANLLNDGIAISKKVNERGYNPKIFCLCGSQVTVLPAWKDMGASGERVFGTTMSWASDKYTNYDKLASHFKSLGISPVPTYAQAAYTALQVLGQAVTEKQTLDQRILNKYIKSGAVFDTVVGKVKFDKNGIPGWNSIMLQVQKGKNEVVWPKNRSTSVPLFPLVK
jgi:branched-chain amino acid transport system substrate-binding protein